MNTWWFLGTVAMTLSVLGALSIQLVGRGMLARGWAGYRSHRMAVREDVRNAAHRAATPIVWGGTLLTIILVVTGWLVGGFTGASAVWILAGLVVFGGTLCVGYVIAERQARTLTADSGRG